MKNFLVIGLGAFGEAVAKTLYAQGHTVMGVDINRERVDRAHEFTSEAVEADVADRDTMGQVLDTLGVENIDTVIVGVGRRLDASVLICLFLKEMNVGRIVAKVLTHDHARVLHRLGVHKSLFPEADSGERLARQLANPNIEDLIHLEDGIEVIEISAPGAFVGSSLEAIQFRREYGMYVIAVRKGISMAVEVLPGAEYVIEKGDILVLIGPVEALEKLPK